MVSSFMSEVAGSDFRASIIKAMFHPHHGHPPSKSEDHQLYLPIVKLCRPAEAQTYPKKF
jgi:hypothetical protein